MGFMQIEQGLESRARCGVRNSVKGRERETKGGSKAWR